jgi:hypothetical protein
VKNAARVQLDFGKRDPSRISSETSNTRQTMEADIRAVSQLLWPDKDGEVWFSLEENHEEAYRSGLHQLRNRSSVMQTAIDPVNLS